ncbi:LOG family protein, partial [Chromobacterium piscinae]
VIPEFLKAKEVAHQGLSELHVTETMHQRKALMAELSDGFVALPGGFGTFDELFKILTWAQLSVHDKPVGMLDAGG